MKPIRLSLAFLILFSLAVAATAGHDPSAPPPPIDATTLRKLTRPSPFRAEFPKSSLRIPEGLRFVTLDNLPDFSERMKLALAGDELGAVVPEDVSWHCMVFNIKDDPLKDQDLSNINREALQVWIEKFTADHAPRKLGSGRTIKVGNMFQPPVYNTEKKTLTVGNRMYVEGAETDHLNYKVFFYGPEGQILCLQTVVPAIGTIYSKVIEANGKALKLNDEVAFPAVAVEGADESGTMMYYAKLIGGGLIGAMIVILLARTLTGRRRAPAASPLRRPGLPR
ncbi:hypothetical protein BH11PLA2_BH11PLA2_23150 [soil metagenome]